MLEKVKEFIYEEDGMGTVEVIVIVAVLIAAALIFKDKITEQVGTMWDAIFVDSGVKEELNPTKP